VINIESDHYQKGPTLNTFKKNRKYGNNFRQLLTSSRYFVISFSRIQIQLITNILIRKKKIIHVIKKKTRQPNSLSRAAGIRCAFNHHLITQSIKRKCNQVGMVGGGLFSMVEKDKKEKLAERLRQQLYRKKESEINKRQTIERLGHQK
jgi:hypothetical protein